MRLPHTFTGGGYQVTVNKDRSIMVKQGDWLSKYSMAIYGDYTKPHIDKFCRGQWLADGRFVRQEIINKDLIQTGWTLYHPDPLPGEEAVGPGEGDPGAEPPLQLKWLVEFLKWAKQRFWACDWRLKGTSGGDLSLFWGNAACAVIDVVHKPVAVQHRLYAGAMGVTASFPRSFWMGATYSSPNMWDIGTIWRAPWHSELSINDFCHGFMAIEIGVGLIRGFSGTLLFFGIGFPLTRVVAALETFFRDGDPKTLGFLMVQGGFSGVAVFAGSNWALPTAGVTLRCGLMYDNRFFRRR